MGAAAHAWRLGLAQRDRPAREALGVGIGIGAGPRARLDLERVERHAGDNAAIFGSDVVGDDGLLAESERDGTAAQFDDLDVSHGGHVSTGEAPVGRLRVCWCWSCTELRRTGPASSSSSSRGRAAPRATALAYSDIVFVHLAVTVKITVMAHDHTPPPDSPLASSSDPDRALKWLCSVVLVGVAVNLLSSAIETQGGALVPPIVFSLAAVTVMPRTGLLRREPHVGTRWTRILALASLLAYLGAAVWGTATAWPLPVMLLSTGFLWATCVLITWASLRSHHDLYSVASGVAVLLLGVAALVLGVAVLREGHALVAVAMLLGGGAMLLLGVAALREGHALVAVAALLGGVAVLLLGVAVLREGHALVAVAMLLGGGAVLLLGVAALREGDTLGGVAVLLVGVAVLLGGVAVLGDQDRGGAPAASAQLLDWLKQR